MLLTLIAAGATTSKVPVAAVQLLASVTLYAYPVPAAMPGKLPVPLVTPLKVYDNAPVPPVALIVSVAVPLLQLIVLCDMLLTLIAAGATTSKVPVAAVQLLASVTLYAYPVPAAMPGKLPVPLVTPLKVYDNAPVPPVAVIVTVAVPLLQLIVLCDMLLTLIAAGATTSKVPVAAVQLLASVTLYAYPVPAAMPGKLPVPLVTPLKVYDNAPVPPVAVIVTVAVPPLQLIVLCDMLLTLIAAGATTSKVPVAAVQLLASVTLYAYPVPAAMPGKLPVPLVTPLKVYDNAPVPPVAVIVTVAVPPLQLLVLCYILLPLIAAGATTSK